MNPATPPDWVESQLAARRPPTAPSLLRMDWENLLFLHWAWDPREIQRTLPPGLSVDPFENKAWLAVVPFFMRRVRPLGFPHLPWISDFLELNVRTYVRDSHGTPGVWFYSLSCHQPLAVISARLLFHLNYVHAKMSAAIGAGTITYRSRRSARPPADFSYRPTGVFRPATPGSLEFFLFERYVLFSTDSRGRLFSGQVSHEPYEWAPVQVEQWSFQPAEDDGFASPGRPPDHLAVAKNLQVKAWPLVPV